jgi:hypothetical protein
MNLDEYQAIERAARMRRAAEIRSLIAFASKALGRLLAREPHKAQPPDPAVGRRFIGLASFQDRLKNSRPPRIAVIRSTSRSKCSGTSTKLRRSLFTMSKGLSE